MEEIISRELKNENFKFITNPIWIDYVISKSQGVTEKKHICLIAIKDITHKPQNELGQ